MVTFWERAARSVDPIFSLSFCNISYFRFGFEGRIWVLIAPVPGHCLLIALIRHELIKQFKASAIIFGKSLLMFMIPIVLAVKNLFRALHFTFL